MTFFLVFNDFFINTVTNLTMPVKLATLGLRKIKTFRDKGYEVIILDCDGTLFNTIQTKEDLLNEFSLKVSFS